MFVNPLWTEEVIARVEKMADRGCAASMIAETINHEFGTSFTRDAVLSKCRRLGVELFGAKGPDRKAA